MARFARVVLAGFPHLVTQRGMRRREIFTSTHDREVYLELLREQCRRFRVKVLAWCLMPKQVHFVMVPAKAAKLARAVASAHLRYSRYRNFAEGERGHLFPGRFGSCVLDKRHLRAAARYAELSPVRAGLARRAEAWRWSSARHHLGEAKTDALVTDRKLMGLVAGPGGWRKLLAAKDAEAEARLERALRTGRVAGDRQFVGRVEKLTGRELWPRKPGPKPRGAKKRGRK